MYDYARPTTLSETFSLLRAVPEARLLGGGTDLLVGLRKGTVRAPLVIDLKRIDDLGEGIEARGATLRVGAGTTMSALASDTRVAAHFPALVEAATVVGSIQIRNRATLAGNLCNASPAADTVPPLLVYGAVVELVAPSGSRRVPLADFLVGPGRTLLGPAELLTAIELPLADGPIGAAFGRMTRRRGVDLATVNLSCSVSASGVTRFAFGAVGPRAFLAIDDSGRLADAAGTPQEDEAILRRMTAEATPISNVRASREYRADMLLVLSRRALATARQRLAQVLDGR